MSKDDRSLTSSFPAETSNGGGWSDLTFHIFFGVVSARSLATIFAPRRSNCWCSSRSTTQIHLGDKDAYSIMKKLVPERSNGWGWMIGWSRSNLALKVLACYRKNCIWSKSQDDTCPPFFNLAPLDTSTSPNHPCHHGTPKFPIFKLKKKIPLQGCHENTKFSLLDWIWPHICQIDPWTHQSDILNQFYYWISFKIGDFHPICNWSSNLGRATL